MKNLILGILLTGLTIAMVSCKKADRVCECTYPDGSKLTITYLEKTPKKSAKKYCEDGISVLDENGVDKTKESDTNCSLK